MLFSDTVIKFCTQPFIATILEVEMRQITSKKLQNLWSNSKFPRPLNSRLNDVCTISSPSIENNNTDNFNINTNNVIDVEDHSSYTHTIFSHSIQIETLKYYFEFQEYPYTSKISTASVCNLSGWNPSEPKETFKLHNIRCAIGNPGKITTPGLLEDKHSYVNFEDDTNKEIF
nr:12281_t:CDS:2 [Entrophospora candida]